MLRLIAVLMLLLATSATSAQAQQTPGVALAADLGPALPLGDFADDGANLGWGAGVTATARLTRLFGLYGQYERTTFPVDDTPDNYTDGSWTDSGLSAGIRFWWPVQPDARLHPWAQLGMGWHDLDKPIAGPEFAANDTDGIRTLEGGAGLDVATPWQGLFLRPTVRYRKYSFEVESVAGTARTNISSITVALGIVVTLLTRDDDGAASTPQSRESNR